MTSKSKASINNAVGRLVLAKEKARTKEKAAKEAAKTVGKAEVNEVDPHLPGGASTTHRRKSGVSPQLVYLILRYADGT